VRFAKLHGAGNDFVLVDGRTGVDRAALAPAVPALCHRRLGLGGDGVLLVTPVGDRVARLEYWNADGSEASFCGNGTRCAARFVVERWGWSSVVLETGYAAIPAEVQGETVTLHLPAPEAVQPWRELATAAGTVRARYLVVGVPHLVLAVEWDDFWTRPLSPLAPELRRHPELPPGGANVNVLKAAEGELAARFWERGVEGETLASGSGVVAVALVALAEGLAAAPVQVATASGRRLTVAPERPDPWGPLRITGPAEWVAEGELAPELLAAQRPGACG
jgi:diaminopimelate epimerase